MKLETAVIIGSVLLAGFLVWKEIKRSAKAHLYLRLLASVLGVTALACLIIPVTYTTQRSSQEGHAIVVLTPGYQADSLNAYSSLQRYTTDASLAIGGNTYIPDLAWFWAQHSSINELHVFGYGLSAHELAPLTAKGINIRYHAATPPAGFTAAGWPRQLHQGEWLEVQGSFHNTGKDKMKIVLTGLGSRFDSVTINDDTAQSFRLRYKPSHEGNTLYALEAISEGKTTFIQKLPVRVLPTNHLQVLLLSSSPDFDHKFLATWLYENQYQVAVRHTISKNKFSQQFLNREVQSLQTISSTLLEKMDVVIADDAALAALPATERTALIAQVQKGMGLILQTDSTVSVKSFASGWQVKKQAGSAVSARTLAMPAVFANTTPLESTQWLSIENNRLAQPLVIDDKGAIVVSAALAGAGKLVLNTVNNTYNWVLNGNKPDYSQFWSLLLNKAARTAPATIRWQQMTDFPTMGNPVQLTVETTGNGMPLLQTPDGPAPVAQHAWLPHTWTGTWWPVSSGWQAVRVDQDSLVLYIYERGDWSTVKATERINTNKAAESLSGDSAEKTKEARGLPIGVTSQRLATEGVIPPQGGTTEEKKMPPVIFFVVFLLCCSYLWFEAKRT